jgi:hypothetical protein
MHVRFSIRMVPAARELPLDRERSDPKESRMTVRIRSAGPHDATALSSSDTRQFRRVAPTVATLAEIRDGVAARRG